MGHGPFSSCEEVEALARGFESQTLLGEHDWTHRDHVATAAYYCLTDPECASDRMRAGIQALNAARGVPQTLTSGYHDTLTIAWTRLIGAHLRSLDTEDRVAKINSVIVALADRRSTRPYYSEAVIMSPEARYGWVEPDLQPLP